jgi:hypothetical protein
MLENYYRLDYGYHHSHRQHFDYLGLGNLAKQLTFLFDTSLDLHNGIDHAVNVIRNSAKDTNRLPVLCLDLNPYDVESILEKLNQQLDPKTFFVFHSDIRAEVSDAINVAPWPSWLCNQHHETNYQIDQLKIYRIGFLSGVARYHRIKLMHAVRPWIQHNDVVVVNRFASHMLSAEYKNLLLDLPYSNRPEFIDNEQNVNNANQSSYNNHPAYAAKVNITAETVGGDRVLFSEKTWKSYRSGCLTVNFGITNAPAVLEKLGIEIWHEYDQSVDWQHKIDKITELFQRDDIDSIYDKLTPMVEHNQNLVSSKDFVKMLATPAIEKILNLLQSK